MGVINVGTIENQEAIIEKLGNVQEIVSQTLGLVADANTVFVSSDTVLKTLLSSEQSVGNSSAGGDYVQKMTIGTITPKYNGALRIKLNVKGGNPTSGYGKLKVNQGSTLINSYNLNETTSYTEKYFDFEVAKGVEYTLVLEQTYMAQLTYCNYAAICGSIQTSSTSLV